MSESSTCYTLYLTTNSIPNQNELSPISNTNLANVSWIVDWDVLFSNEQPKYKHCRLRYEFQTQNKATSSNWDTYLGYLTCNLASNHQGTTGMGTVLGLLYYTFKVHYISGRVGTECTQFEINTMNTAGIDIVVPRGRDVLNIKLMNDDAFTQFNQHQQNWQILMQFELYNEE